MYGLKVCTAHGGLVPAARHKSRRPRQYDELERLFQRAVHKHLRAQDKILRRFRNPPEGL